MLEYKTLNAPNMEQFEIELNKLAAQNFRMINETFEHSLEVSCVLSRTICTNCGTEGCRE